MLQHLFLFLGSLIIGFGIGLIAGNYFTLSFALLWTLIITSLVIGGFILAFSFRHSSKPTTTIKSNKASEAQITNQQNEEQNLSNERPESTDNQ